MKTELFISLIILCLLLNWLVQGTGPKKVRLGYSSVMIIVMSAVVAILSRVPSARRDETAQPIKARLSWPVGQPGLNEVSRVCPSGGGASGSASSSLNFVINEKTGGATFADVELLPGCTIEYTIAGNKTVITLPNKD